MALSGFVVIGLLVSLPRTPHDIDV
jgi:hypothetical protein